jgi:hypothetical protein
MFISDQTMGNWYAREVAIRSGWLKRIGDQMEEALIYNEHNPEWRDPKREHVGMFFSSTHLSLSPNSGQEAFPKRILYF